MRRDELRAWISENERLDFSRSGGPGGQNVNKVNTKVTLHLPVDRLPVDPEAIEQVRARLCTRINSDGELVIQASTARSQTGNRADAEDRALFMIEGALFNHRHRRATRPSAAARARRLAAKRRNAIKKNLRGRPQED